MKTKLFLLAAAFSSSIPLLTAKEAPPDAPMPPGARPANPQAFLDGMFKRLDANGDGKVSKDEFIENSKKEAEARFNKKLDPTRSGFMTKEGFKNHFVLDMADGAKHGQGEPAELKKGLDEEFKKMDPNGDGKVSKDEFIETAKNEAEARFNQKLDPSGSGFVTKERFNKAMLDTAESEADPKGPAKE